MGENFTAGELYAYFVNARKLTCKRPRAWINPERRQQLLPQSADDVDFLQDLCGRGCPEAGMGRDGRRYSAAREASAIAPLVRLLKSLWLLYGWGGHQSSSFTPAATPQSAQNFKLDE